MDADSLNPRVVKMIKFLTESHLDAFGGYPYDWTIIGDQVVVAELDDGKDRQRTQLAIWTVPELLAWHDRAVAEQAADVECDWIDACLEAYPEGK